MCVKLHSWRSMAAGIAIGAIGSRLTWWGLLVLRQKFWRKREDVDQGSSTSDTEVIFFPDTRVEWGIGDSCGGEGMTKVLRTLNQAKKSLDLALYSFTNKRLAREVISCMNRGVKVRLVAESTNIDLRHSSSCQVGRKLVKLDK